MALLSVIKPEAETEYGTHCNGTDEERPSCGYASNNYQYHADDNYQTDRMCGENSDAIRTIWADSALIKNRLRGIVLVGLSHPEISR